MRGKALWYVEPGRAELREEAVAAPKDGEVQVRSLFGAVSRGTERLVHAGRVPASEYQRRRSAPASPSRMPRRAIAISCFMQAAAGRVSPPRFGSRARRRSSRS